MQATATNPVPIRSKSKWRKRFGRASRWLFLVLSLLFALSLIGRDDYQPEELQERAIAERFEDSTFDLVGWEISAVREKIGSYFQPPASGINEDEGIDLIFTYLDRAREIARLNTEANRIAAHASDASDQAATETIAEEASQAAVKRAEIESEIADLRIAQEQIRPAVEQLIQSQVDWALSEEEITVGNRVLPPVLFSFTEPPKKLVVSPRDRIETRYARMIAADIPLAEVSENERDIFQQEDLSAYVANIGGLGAFPTMVIDRASLGWILSTVAHEWVHNYLTFFPLGINYGKSNEITIINETVAEIVGNEIGKMVEAEYYPATVTPQPTSTPEPTPTPDPETNPTAQNTTASEEASNTGESIEEESIEEEPQFDFRTEMRETRLQVDRLLADGKVADAERYMEERRLEFVEKGYNLRVLNQAYFAFHGSYGTSAASTSTIGPKLEELREKSGDLKTFLQVVRWITTEAEIDQALESSP